MKLKRNIWLYTYHGCNFLRFILSPKTKITTHTHHHISIHTQISPEHPSHLRTESPSLKYPLHLKKEDYIIM